MLTQNEIIILFGLCIYAIGCHNDAAFEIAYFLAMCVVTFVLCIVCILKFLREHICFG